MTDNPTYLCGLENLRRIEGNNTPAILDTLDDIAPDLGEMIIRFVYGEIYSRDGLDLARRQLVTVAVLAALGNARPQLKFHLTGALLAGCTPTQLVETMIHLAVYAGFPACLNGMFVLKEIFAERGITAPASPAADSSSRRYDTGWATLQRIDGEAGERVIQSLHDICPDLGRMIIEFSFGEIYGRAGLDLLDRELVTVASLVALGTAVPQLQVHVHGLLNVGGTRAQVVEAVTHVAAYAGFPAAINGMLVVQDALRERGQ